MKKLKTMLAALLALALLVSAATFAAPSAYADATRLEYEFSVPKPADSTDEEYDEHHIYITRNAKGAFDPILVTFTVHFLDAADQYMLRFMQNELMYDTGFFYTSRSKGTSLIDVSFVQYLGTPMIKLSTMSVTLTSPDTAVASFYLTPRENLANGTTTTLRSSSVLCYDASGQRCAITTQDLTITIGPRPLPTSTVTYFTAGGEMAPTAFPEIDAEYIYYEDETPYYAETVLTDSAITLPGAPTKENYDFMGWSDGTNLYAAGATVTVTDDVSFVASWKAYPTLTLNGNGGSVAGSTKITAKTGVAVTLPTATKSLNDFAGWTDGVNDYTDVFVMGTDNATLTAKWSPWPVVIFNIAGGTMNETTQRTVAPYTTITLPTPAREGYTFTGWQGISGSTYTVGDSDVTIVATWAKNYTLTLDPDGGAVPGALSFTAPAGVSIALPNAIKNDSLFGGWVYNGVTAGASFTMLAQDVTLKASWTAYPTLLLDADGGTVAGDTAFTRAPGTTVDLPAATKAGYTFDGWEYGTDLYKTSFTLESDSVTLRAKWTEYPTLILDPADGKLNGEAVSYTDAPDTFVVLPTPTKVGYTFGGWSDGANIYTTGYMLSAGTVTLTAAWNECDHAKTAYDVISVTEWEAGEGVHTHTTYYSGVCPDCGETLSKSEESSEACTYSTKWSITATEHYHVCTLCGGIAHREEHVYSSGVCKVCGFKNPNSIVVVPAGSSSENVDNGVKTEVPDGYKAEASVMLDGSVLVEVTDNSGKEAEVPVKVKLDNAGYGQVVALIDNNSGKVVEYIKKSYVEDDTAYVLIEKTSRLKIMDNAMYFDDVSYFDWFKNSVDFASSHELFNGTAADTFSPNANMTRAMLVTVLHRLEDKPESAAANLFQDVPNGQWYSAAIVWASENHIVDGYGNGTFGTNDYVTRQQMATILCRYAKTLGVDVSGTELSGYADADKVASWASEGMEWCVGSGIITGKTATTLDPTGYATRAEVATMLMRFVKLIVK